MLDLKYIKEYSFRNKNSSTNKIVIDKLIQLDKKAKDKNTMRVSVVRTTIDLPYSLNIIQKEINESSALIRVEVKVKLIKLILLYAITSISVAALLTIMVRSYWVIVPTVFFAFLFYYLSRQQVINFTTKLVEGWFNKGYL